MYPGYSGDYNFANWKYHVAPIINLVNNGENGEHYILDPAVSSTPITKAEWVQLLSQDGRAQITGSVTCKENAVGMVWDDCLNSDFDEDNNEVDKKYLDDTIELYLNT